MSKWSDETIERAVFLKKALEKSPFPSKEIRLPHGSLDPFIDGTIKLTQYVELMEKFISETGFYFSPNMGKQICLGCGLIVDEKENQESINTKGVNLLDIGHHEKCLVGIVKNRRKGEPNG